MRREEPAFGGKTVRQSDWKVIRALPLFRDMSEANFDELVSAAFLQRFPQHVTLITEGGMPDFLHIVVEGSVELYGIHDRHETTLDIVRPVSTFILAAVIRDDVYLKSARTLMPSQILMIPAKTVRDVFDRDHAFARAIVNELAERYRSVVRSLKNEKLRTSAERLANWASSLGMTPENLSRNLALLAKYGVRSSGRDIIIEDSMALERFAKPNALIDG
ncbi:MAG: cyclic nucleotide-binding domain-containing protein [Rhizobiales bacterium]|nr:cyclic nucleotide-binding domain-containing protein [Hyphomicrobiales bacterium]